MRTLAIRIAADGAMLCVPDSLDAITTYVLLEQEAWFEKEVPFVRRLMKPGMTAIDIGANLGTYSIPMARQVAPTGTVHAYEPASQTRALLTRSAELNGCASLIIHAAGLSNRAGEAHLSFGGSSELNALGEGGAGERVAITSLDLEDAAGRWPQPVDFIKMDAEGEEERILEGGQRFFARHSPLVMFEIKAGDAINHQLSSRFSAMGYGLYRLLAGAPVLVAHPPGAPIDGFELNLFAARPDRAAKLVADGLLATPLPTWAADAAARQQAMTVLNRYPFGAQLVASFGGASSADAAYRDALAAYGCWRDADNPLDLRCAALNSAFAGLQTCAAAKPSLARLSSFARAAWDAGQRSVCVGALTQLLDRLMKGAGELDEPFWPAAPRFDVIDPGRDKGAWFVGAAFEQFERAHSFSTFFAPSRIDLRSLCSNPFASAEMERRRILQLARGGQHPNVSARLWVPAADHVNADLWRAGRVPGTVARI